MIIDGRKIANDIFEKIKIEVQQLAFQPVFCDVLVGTNPASVQYVAMKAKKAEIVGFAFHQAVFAETTPTENLILEIERLNQQKNMCGLIVQLPLPKHIDTQAILDTIDPKIDVDCMGTTNSNLFYRGNSSLEFPTASAIMELLDSTGINLQDKKFLVIGQGQLVGRPVTFMLKQRDYHVETADIHTKNISELLKRADVIISGAGQPGLITGDIIQPRAIVIDAGTGESNGGIVGDVDFQSVCNVASFLSPVPGGVGPVTIAKLFYNVLKVAKKDKKIF